MYVVHFIATDAVQLIIYKTLECTNQCTVVYIAKAK